MIANIAVRSAVDDGFRPQERELTRTVRLNTLAPQFAKMPHIEKLVVALRHSEGLHLGEIAVALGIPPAQVDRIYERAIATITELRGTDSSGPYRS